MYQKLNRVEQILFDAGALLLLLFYVFSAVIMPMATQYHRGIYTLSLIHISEPTRQP